MSWKWLVVVAGWTQTGCSEDAPQMATAESAVAMVSPPGLDNKMRLAFVDADSKARLPELLSGLRPKDIRWVMFTLDAASHDQLVSERGLRLDFLTQNGASFEQVYIGPCNPALQKYDSCLLYENIVAGAEGVTGTIGLRLGTKLDADYDVTIEGQTDRFGEPVQWHKHGSIGNVSAVVTGGAL